MTNYQRLLAALPHLTPAELNGLKIAIDATQKKRVEDYYKGKGKQQ